MPLNFEPPPIQKLRAIEGLTQGLEAVGFKKSLFYMDDGNGGATPRNLTARQLATLVMNMLMPYPTTPTAKPGGRIGGAHEGAPNAGIQP